MRGRGLGGGRVREIRGLVKARVRDPGLCENGGGVAGLAAGRCDSLRFVAVVARSRSLLSCYDLRMIDEIHVQNLALIRDATLAPSQGLTVLTGETGAGKTALLSALKLLMGARASSDMVRDGESGLIVEGRFFGIDRAASRTATGAAARAAGGAVGEAASQAAAGATSPEANDETIVVRRVGSDGRSRATMNGTMASMHEVAERVSPSIDLCGQFEHQQLMRPATHAGMLDAWAKEKTAEPLARYRAALEAARAAQRNLDEIQEASNASSSMLDDARFTLRRIDEVSPELGEYEELKRELDRAEHAEALAVAVSGAHSALSDDGGALDGLNAAASALESAAHIDEELAAMAQSLREAGYILEDVATSTRNYRDTVEFDPQTLAQQQERFSQMQGLLRSYGPRMEDVLTAREEAQKIVSLVDDSAAHLEKARRQLEKSEAELAEAADALDAAREAVAPLFSNAVSAVMARLEMAGAELVCKQTRLERPNWTTTGPSSVEFFFRPGSGMQPRPLARIASGGEVSRVMLSIKVVLGADDDVDTLVFDEVDAGVGGAVAVALADVIADLAHTHQVIVVTHLAQVAVRADTHYVVSRFEGEAGPETSLSPVVGEQREAEIARMLSGTSTEASLAHARELLKS